MAFEIIPDEGENPFSIIEDPIENYTPAVQSDPYASLFEGDPSTWMSTALEPATSMPAQRYYPEASVQIANIAGPIAEGAAKGVMGIPDLFGMAYNYATPKDWSKVPRLGEALARALYPEDLKRQVEEARGDNWVTRQAGHVADILGTGEEFLVGGGAFSKAAKGIGAAKTTLPTLSRAGEYLGKYDKAAQAMDLGIGTLAGTAGELGGEKAKMWTSLAPAGLVGGLAAISKVPGLSKVPGAIGNGLNWMVDAVSRGTVNPKEMFLNYLARNDPNARALLTEPIDDIAKAQELAAATAGVKTGVGYPDLSGADSAAAGELSLLERAAAEAGDPAAVLNLKPLTGEASAAAAREVSPFTMDQFGDKLMQPTEKLGHTIQKEVQAIDTIEHARVNDQLNALSSEVPKSAGAEGAAAVTEMQKTLARRLEDNPVLKKDPDFREVTETIKSWKPGREWSENSLKNIHESLSQLQRKLGGSAGELAGELLGQVKRIAKEINPKLNSAWEDYAKYIEKFRSPDKNLTSRLAAGNTDKTSKQLSAFESYKEVSTLDSSHFDNLGRTIGVDKTRDFFKRRLAADFEDKLASFAMSAPEGGVLNQMREFASGLLKNKAMLRKVYQKDYRKLVNALEDMKKASSRKGLADKLDVGAFTPLGSMNPIEIGTKIGPKNSPLFFYTNVRRVLGLLYSGKQQAVNRKIYDDLGAKFGVAPLPKRAPSTAADSAVRSLSRETPTQWEVLADALDWGKTREWTGSRGESSSLGGFSVLDEPEQKKKLTEVDMSASDKSMQQALGLRDRVIKAESSGNPKAVSNKDAKGLMQLTDIAVRDVAQEYGMDPSELDVFNGEQNKEWGTKFLAMMLDRFNGDEKLALAAYNMGPTALRKMLDKYDVSTWDELEKKMPSKSYTETKDYVAKIMKAGNVG